MSNTRRIVLLVTILLMLAFPVRTIMDYKYDGCFTAFTHHCWDYDDAEENRDDAIKQALLIIVGGIAAWVLIPGKKPDPE